MKMHRIIQVSAALAVSLGWVVGSAVAQTRTVTLDEAVVLAQRYSPTIIQALGNIRIAQATKRQTFSDWLPRVSGSTGWSVNSSNRFDETTQRLVSGSSTSMNGSLNASYTLFDGFRRSAQASSRNADLISAEAAHTTQEFQIALQTKQAFFNAVAAEELVRVSETRITRANRQLQVARDRLAAGSVIRSDTLRSFVELANARLQLISSQTQLSTSSANLARLIGYDGDVQVVTDSSISFLAEIDTAALRAEALEYGPDAEQARSAARAADAQVGVSRAAYFPSVTASYSRSVAGQELNALRGSWSGRVSLSWGIFQGFGRETSMVQSSARLEAAEARIDDTRRLINAQLTQQFAALHSARIRLEIAQASRAAAEEDLRVQQERYRLGAAIIVEVMNSQVNLDQAEVDAVQARLDYQLARAQIEAIIGREI
jgi:outer membrane protein TolC